MRPSPTSYARGSLRALYLQLTQVRSFRQDPDLVAANYAHAHAAAVHYVLDLALALVLGLDLALALDPAATAAFFLGDVPSQD